MTYVSRKTRIIVSRWSDECDAEYTLRACRRRSDGRLKRHISCDDLRAWVNNSCVRHEYLVDFMSDGEFLGKPPFRLYGRFIPVPILFKLMETTKLTDENKVQPERSVRFKSTAKKHDEYLKKSSSDSGSQLEVKTNFSDFEWEKTVLERRLCQCACLLNRAMGKLEKIDIIVNYSCFQNDNIEAARNEEIQNAFYESKQKCTCVTRNNTSENLLPSKSCTKKLKESAKCTELMRKISGLKEKIKKIQDCRQEISQQIRASQKRAEICSSSNQVTELYSRREQAHIKKLQRKLEKLISEKGKLISEMCHMLTCLKSLRKASRLSVSSTKNKSRTSRNSAADCNCERPVKPVDCCPCPCSDYIMSTDSERVRGSGSSSVECDMYRGMEEMNLDFEFNNDLESPDVQAHSTDVFPDYESVYSEFYSGDEEYKRDASSQKENASFRLDKSSAFEVHNPEKEKATTKKEKIKNQEKTIKNEEKNEKTEDKNSSKKSRVSFFCPQPSCRKIIDADDLAAYEESITPAQQALIFKAVKSIENCRPNTSPTTKKERNAAVAAGQNRAGEYPLRSSVEDHIPERQIKSEATMQDIEKTLRNYEQRLNQLDSLEGKIEELKHDSSEASWLKDNLEKLKAKVKVQKTAEREKTNREMTKLCTENWELKRHVEQLTTKFEAQCRKLQSLKSNSILKERELECEAEELKKELSQYRERFERQRKCISKWESLVAMQRKEIENLMNHIRTLTTMKEESPCTGYQWKKNVQRSRSYSPEIKTRGALTRTKPSAKNYRPSEEEENSLCYCREYSFLEEDNRWRGQQRASNRAYCPVQPPRGTQWCN